MNCYDLPFYMDSDDMIEIQERVRKENQYLLSEPEIKENLNAMSFAPSAYIINVKDKKDIKKVKEQIQKIDPNLCVLGRDQSLNPMEAIIQKEEEAARMMALSMVLVIVVLSVLLE